MKRKEVTNEHERTKPKQKTKNPSLPSPSSPQHPAWSGEHRGEQYQSSTPFYAIFMWARSLPPHSHFPVEGIGGRARNFGSIFVYCTQPPRFGSIWEGWVSVFLGLLGRRRLFHLLVLNLTRRFRVDLGRVEFPFFWAFSGSFFPLRRHAVDMPLSRACG